METIMMIIMTQALVEFGVVQYNIALSNDSSTHNYL